MTIPTPDQRDPLRALIRSTLEFYARFEVTFDVEDAIRNFQEEVGEVIAAARDGGNTGHIAEEAADVMVTVIGVCEAAGVSMEDVIAQVYKVAAKNDAKTHETHVYVNGKITRRSLLEGRE